MTTLTDIVETHDLTFFDTNIANPPEKDSLLHTLNNSVENPGEVDPNLVFTYMLRKRFIANQLVRRNIGRKKFVTTPAILEEMKREQKFMSMYLHQQNQRVQAMEKRHEMVNARTDLLLSDVSDYLAQDNELIRITRRNLYNIKENSQHLALIRSIFSSIEDKRKKPRSEKGEPRYKFLNKPVGIPCSVDVDLLSKAVHASIYRDVGNVAIVTNDKGIYRMYGLLLRMLPQVIKGVKKDGTTFEHDPLDFTERLAKNPIRTYSDYRGGGSFYQTAGMGRQVEPIIEALS